MKSTAVAVCVFVAASAGAPNQSEPCAAIAPSAQILEVGTFSDMRYTKEHAYGQTVSLWRSGDCVFGIFAWSGGLAGDTPIGELQAVRHDVGHGRAGVLRQTDDRRLQAARGDGLPAHA